MRKRNIFILVPILVILLLVYIKYREIPYEDYQNHTLIEMQKEMLKLNNDLERVTSSYANKNDIDDTYKKNLYDCVGNLIYTEPSDLKFIDVLSKCKDDYNKNLNLTYFNQYWLMRDFNRYNGSYIPLEKIIKKTIKEVETYKMIKTTFKMRFNDERPHMFVSIDFRAANIQGYMLNRNMSAKVDAKTKEIYDIK